MTRPTTPRLRPLRRSAKQTMIWQRRSRMPYRTITGRGIDSESESSRAGILSKRLFTQRSHQDEGKRADTRSQWR